MFCRVRRVEIAGRLRICGEYQIFSDFTIFHSAGREEINLQPDRIRYGFGEHLKKTEKLLKNTVRFAAAAICLLAVLARPAFAISDSDRMLITQSLSPDATAATKEAAKQLVGQAAHKHDFTVFDYLISIDAMQLVQNFGLSLPYGRWGNEELLPELDARILAHFDKREVAIALLPAIRKSDNPELFELMFKDVARVAQWRVDQRRRCKTKIMQIRTLLPNGQTDVIPSGVYQDVNQYRYTNNLGNHSALYWKFVCTGTPQGSDAPEFDGFFSALHTARHRELASLAAISKSTVPGVEARLAALFFDLSYFPPIDWSGIDKRPVWSHVSSVHPPLNILESLLERGYRPDTERIIDMLVECGNGLPTDLKKGESLNTAKSLLKGLVPAQTRAASETVVNWLIRMTALEDATIRHDSLAPLIPRLGFVPESAQIDLTALKKSVYENVPYQQIAEFTTLFDEVEKDNLAFRNMNADSLARAIRSPYAPQAVAWLLANGVSPNAKPPPPQEPAFLKAAQVYAKLVPLFIDKGVDVNMRDSQGHNALHLVLGNRNEDTRAVFRLLLARGTDVNATTSMGATPLHYATQNPETLKLLLSAGVKVDAVDVMGRSALFSAVINNDLAAAEALLIAGANPNREDKQGMSPYSDSLTRSNPALTALLVKHGGRSSAGQSAKQGGGKVLQEALKLLWDRPKN